MPKMLSTEGKYLDGDGQLVTRVKDLKFTKSELAYHMGAIHDQWGVYHLTKGELAKIHLITHTLEAYPELKEFFEMQLKGQFQMEIDLPHTQQLDDEILAGGHRPALR